jgi:peptide/nickel transport system substrate-binding protein
MRGKEGSGIRGTERSELLDFGCGIPFFRSFHCSMSISALLLSSVFLLTSCARSVASSPGVVNFVIESMPTNLDPRIGTDGQSERIDSLIFSGLVELDEQRNVHGDLAEKWETPDPLTYVFHLRPGVKFHDGRALTSADVKYTFESILDRSVTSPKRGSISVIRSMETPDPATIIFHLSEPQAGFLWNISRTAMGIVPTGSGDELAQHPIGTGAFRFVSARQDDNIVLERNPSYFRTPSNIAEVQFRVVPEAIVRALELRKGTADLELTSLTPDMISVLRSQPELKISDQPGSNYDYIVFNFDDPILAKREVRQALALATDRPQIIKYLLHGEARLANGPTPPNNWAYEPDVKQFNYDPQAAEALLEQAGYPRVSSTGGIRIKLTMKTSTEESARLLGSVLQEQWRKVGVDLELRPLEIATLLSDLTRGSFQLSTLRWIGGNNDPDLFLQYIFSSKKAPPTGANRGHYHNPQVDALLDEASREGDQEKRRKLYSAIEKLVAEDVPYVSLWYRDNVCVHRNRITDVHLSASGEYDFLREIQAR